MRGEQVLVEGYASLFGVADRMGDVVRAGAFAASLRRRPEVAMLWQHAHGRLAGRWSIVREDGRGLYVRGLVEGDLPGGRAGLEAVRRRGVNGLSIGFRPVRWRLRPGGGRELIEVELIEVSLVSEPALAGARFTVAGARAPMAA